MCERLDQTGNSPADGELCGADFDDRLKLEAVAGVHLRADRRYERMK